MLRFLQGVGLDDPQFPLQLHDSMILRQSYSHKTSSLGKQSSIKIKKDSNYGFNSSLNSVELMEAAVAGFSSPQGAE